MLEKDTDILKLVKKVRKLVQVKEIILKKHQRKLIKYFHSNVVNPENEKPKRGGWRNLLANLGQVKRVFNSAAEKKEKVDLKIVKHLLSKEDYQEFCDRVYERDSQNLSLRRKNNNRGSMIYHHIKSDKLNLETKSAEGETSAANFNYLDQSSLGKENKILSNYQTSRGLLDEDSMSKEGETEKQKLDRKF